MKNKPLPREVTGVFIDCLRCWCEAKENFALEDLMNSLKEHLDDGSELWGRMANDLLLGSKEQKAAERALCEVAESMDVRKQYRARTWSEKPGREVDWGQTRLRQLSGEVGRYCNLRRNEHVDLQTAGALRNLASRWLRLLDSCRWYDLSGRVDALKDAVLKLDARSAVWSTAVERRLLQQRPENAKAIIASVRLWSSKHLSGRELAETLKSWIDRNEEFFRGEMATNADNLFEWIITRRIAVSARQQGKWTWVDGDDPSVIRLERNDWQLAIYKGRLRKCGTEHIDDGSRISDEVRRALEHAGLKSNGLQPDIVMEFFKPSWPASTQSCYFIADAKRNGSGDGENYIRASICKAATYVHAFNGSLANVNPRCTLFFWQGVKQVGRERKGEGPGQPDFSSAGPILCLDLEWMDQGGLLEMWLEHLFVQVCTDQVFP